jgi:hypothetical protein
LNQLKREFADELRNIKEGQERQEEREEQTKIDLATLRALGGGEPTTVNKFASLFGSLFRTETDGEI